MQEALRAVIVLTAGRSLVGVLTGVRRTAQLEQELREATARLRHESLHDPLTGVGNRASLGQVRGGTRTPSLRALLLVDLDDFRVINDTLGYDVGDEVLRQVARQLQKAVRSGDDVLRLGGDEFAVLLADSDSDAARAVADCLLAALAEPLSISDRPVFVRASVGIATNDREASLESLLQHANASMYAVKTGTSSDKVAVFDPESHQVIIDELMLAGDLRSALGNDEFLLHYQPIVELDSRRTVGFEALLRWRHPQRGFVPPMDFITLAEQAGLMPEIGEWILGEAAREAARWHGRSGHSPYVSVNFSVRQFQDHDFTSRFDRALGSAGLPADRLVVEVTETAVAADLGVVRDKLAQVRDRGARVYIDDFGTGYSSLSYLRDLPLDGVKLDRAFCQDIVTSQDAWALAQAIVSMLHNLNLEITAEGVESAAQLAQLRSLGCAHAQGYYFARPQPTHDVAGLLPTDPVGVVP